MDKVNPITWISHLLVVIGGLNWGLIAINADWNLVTMLFDRWPIVVTIIYALVGLAAVWMLVQLFTGCKK
jgi:uncharacterized membrane protein YuzA (DUF378 family)